MHNTTMVREAFWTWMAENFYQNSFIRVPLRCARLPPENCSKQQTFVVATEKKW